MSEKIINKKFKSELDRKENKKKKKKKKKKRTGHR